jgi:ATP-dependent exoDNAse (exonuclease V) beta subunit
VSGDVLPGRLQASRDLLGGMSWALTPEQTAAVERDRGVVLLDASAGSGKTSVLVERFVRAVLEGGADVRSILAITFTEKAAGEMRERIRARLRDKGAEQAARATEGANILTIHAFCARLIRAGAIELGIDPAFVVLDEHETLRLAADAFEAALAQLAESVGGARLISAHGPDALRAAIVSTYDKLRSLGQPVPSLPPATGGEELGQPRLASAVAELRRAAAQAAGELDRIDEPPARVRQGLEALARATELSAQGAWPWPGELGGLALPTEGAAGALSTDVCGGYRDALETLKRLSGRAYGAEMRDELDKLLRAYGERFGALKRQRSAVDFEDLQLLALELMSRPATAARQRERFTHVMVDELQDTNRLQFALIDLLSGDNLFMVGDAQQSIYGFRHADLELFAQRGRELEARGARLALRTNFRSRREIIAVLNTAFTSLLGDRFRPLVPGRRETASTEPLVELMIVDKGADWETDGLAAPWRQAEARVLATRVLELTQAGTAAGEIVVLTRAATDLRVYERALEAAGVATYTVGGRGYWSHPQVVELVSYLRALANPLDLESLYGTWCSPLCGLSLDGLVLLAADAADELMPADAERIQAFNRWFEAERSRSVLLGPEELLNAAIERSGYVLAVLAQPGGRRRLANIRKLLRLAREWEAAAGNDLHGFLELIADRAQQSDREGDAPVESEALDAVRLMTIHRAKGLEFPTVCVADLGRAPVQRPEVIRLSRDGARLGLRIARPGTAARIPALDYEALGAEQLDAWAGEERRLFYVAMTRARERLLLSGAARMDAWAKGNQGTPIDWLAPALIPDIATEQTCRTTPLGVRVTFFDSAPAGRSHPVSVAPGAGLPGQSVGGPLVPTEERMRTPVATISYSALEQYERCGYRFYVERVLGIPPVHRDATSMPRSPAAARGTAVHEALQRLDFRRPLAPAASELRDLPHEDVIAIQKMVERFAATGTCRRLARAREVRREQPFALSLSRAGSGGELPLLTGAFDVLAREDARRLLVVDYKTDRLHGTDPDQLVAERYLLQRQIYALAALRTGAVTAEIIHLFLELPEAPVSRLFDAGDADELELEIGRRASLVSSRQFLVAAQPSLALCGGCPAEAGLCSWPPSLTRQPAEAPARR